MLLRAPTQVLASGAAAYHTTGVGLSNAGIGPAHTAVLCRPEPSLSMDVRRTEEIIRAHHSIGRCAGDLRPGGRDRYDCEAGEHPPLSGAADNQRGFNEMTHGAYRALNETH